MYFANIQQIKSKFNINIFRSKIFRVSTAPIYTRNIKFGTWPEADDGTNLAPRMPYYTNSGNAYLTTDADNGGNWWGALVTQSAGWTSAPWMASGGVQSPTNIWYWVR